MSKWYHCWFSKTHQYYCREEFEEDPIYQLKDGTEVVVTCVIEDTGNFEYDKAQASKFLFPDSIYLGVGKMVEIGKLKKAALMNRANIIQYFETMFDRIKRAKMESN